MSGSDHATSDVRPLPKIVIWLLAPGGTAIGLLCDKTGCAQTFAVTTSTATVTMNLAKAMSRM